MIAGRVTSAFTVVERVDAPLAENAAFRRLARGETEDASERLPAPAGSSERKTRRARQTILEK
jgi:hypothetical protein